MYLFVLQNHVPDISLLALAYMHTCIDIDLHCDTWEMGGADRFPSVTMYANTTLTLLLPLPLGVGSLLI